MSPSQEPEPFAPAAGMDRESEQVGRNYRLVPLREEQITDRYVAWLNDPEVNRFLEVRWTPQTRATVREFVRSFYGGPENYLWGIYPRTENELIGTVSLHTINPYHGFAHFGLLIGEQAYWGRGASMEAVELLLHFAFEVRGLRRLTGGTYANHHAMNFTFKRLGFTLEGKYRQALQVSPGVYVDNYRWGLLAEEWRQRRREPVQ